MTDSPRAVLFDFGGVLTSAVADSFGVWVVENDVDGPAAAAVIGGWLSGAQGEPNPLHALETGSAPAHEFETALAERLRRRDGSPVSPVGLLDGLFAGLRPQEEMWQLAGELRRSGTAVGLLSNSWGGQYPEQRLAEVFDDVVISERVGLRKPDPAIYRLAAQRIGVAATGCVFIDDLPINVTAAQRLGMSGIVHKDPAGTRLALQRLGLLPGPQPAPPG